MFFFIVAPPANVLAADVSGEQIRAECTCSLFIVGRVRGPEGVLRCNAVRPPPPFLHVFFDVVIADRLRKGLIPTNQQPSH